MDGLLKQIFTTRYVPNGAVSLEAAIWKGLTSASNANAMRPTKHGVMITHYDPGWIVSKNEKNIRYKLSAPQADIPDGRCYCTVGNSFAQKAMGGGLVPVSRPMLPDDGVVALTISLMRNEHLAPSYEDSLQNIARKLTCDIYVHDHVYRALWKLNGETKEQLGYR